MNSYFTCIVYASCTRNLTGRKFHFVFQQQRCSVSLPFFLHREIFLFFLSFFLARLSSDDAAAVVRLLSREERESAREARNARSWVCLERDKSPGICTRVE